MAASRKTVTPQRDEEQISDEVRHKKQLADAVKKRERQSLELQRENILSQKTSNPNRRTALEAALKQVEGQLAKFD
jgi:hypothetical protein